jgi:NADH dehydrogenase (ubiquinone) 1 alpha subcomplex subunit 2
MPFFCLTPPVPPPPSRSVFLAASLADLKTANPGFPLLVRERDGAPAAAVARFDFGVEAAAPLDGLDAAGVDAALADLVKRGEGMPRSTESEGALPKATA